jgi:hypothetical protein
MSSSDKRMSQPSRPKWPAKPEAGGTASKPLTSETSDAGTSAQVCPPEMAASDAEIASPALASVTAEPVDAASDSVNATEVDALLSRQHPIPPPSEPLQYRAIGLLRGCYTPHSEEELAIGTLTMLDGTVLPAVLLGRMLSLVKKYLDLEQSYLWVVYPRAGQTSKPEDSLKVQIVGVWEPELLSAHKTDVSEASQVVPPTAEPIALSSLPQPEDGYFSVRGEVVYHAPDSDNIVVKIQQISRKPQQAGRAFKLSLKGTLTGKVLGYFWDLDVHRVKDTLVIQRATSVAMLPPKKKSPRSKDFSPAKGRGRDFQRREVDRPVRTSTDQTAPRKAPLPQPTKRPQKRSDMPRPQKPSTSE